MRKTIKLREKEVEYCLKHFPETRNSDITLLIRIWEQYHKQRIFISHTGDNAIHLDDLYDLPREDAVKRIRANFNSKRKYLPTSEKVAKQRQMNIEEWRAWLKDEGVEEEVPAPPKEPEKCEHGLPTYVACPNCQKV